jgi:hypothetical protein
MRVLTFMGDYGERRDAAARAGCKVHVTWHFNSGGGSYALVEITSAADARCKALAADLVAEAARIFGIKNGGVRVLDRSDSGWVCIGDELPGIILEPAFGDVKAQADLMHKPEKQEEWAQAVARCMKKHYRDDELAAFTLGHKYKTSNPDDEGASLAGGGTEASWNEPIMERTIALLAESEPVTYKVMGLSTRNHGKTGADEEFEKLLRDLCHRYGKALFETKEAKVLPEWPRGWYHLK